MSAVDDRWRAALAEKEKAEAKRLAAEIAFADTLVRRDKVKAATAEAARRLAESQARARGAR